MSFQNLTRRATAYSVYANQQVNESAHRRNKSASALNIEKMPANKRAFGVDVSNARKELNNVAATVGYKKNNNENVNPNVGIDNVKGLSAPAVRPSNGGLIATKTQQASLNAVKPVSGSVAQATYPVNGAQAARPRALSKRAINNTVFRDEESLNTVLPTTETHDAPAPSAHQELAVNSKASELVEDDLSPALARLSVSPSLSGSPSLKLTVPTADGGMEVWDSDDEYDQGYVSAEDEEQVCIGIPAARFNPVFNASVFSDAQTRKLQVAAHFVKKGYTQKDMEDDLKDITMAAEYADEIFAYMNEIEIKNIAPHNYMDGFQTEVKADMRRVLMDWLVQVHARFNMLPETLYLCVNYIDRFLASKVVSLGKLQLVGATAILLAAKVEEVNAPTIPEIVYMVDDTYGADEVLKAERFMLGQLKWEMQFPGPMSFLRRISKADDYDIEVRTMAKYLLEVQLMDYRLAAVPPSFAAAAAVCLARELLMKGKWTPAHAHYSGYTGEQLLPLCNVIVDILRMDPQHHHSAVYEKYSHRRYNQFSTTCQDIIKGTWTGKEYKLPQVLDDGKIFDYEEPCDGQTAFLRSSVMASLGMTEEARALCENIYYRTQAQADSVRRQQQEAQAYATVPFGFHAPNMDEVSA